MSPTHLIVPSPPMPFQLVNDRTTVAIAGSQTSDTTRAVGTTTMTTTRTRSHLPSRRTRRLAGTRTGTGALVGSGSATPAAAG